VLKTVIITTPDNNLNLAHVFSSQIILLIDTDDIKKNIQSKNSWIDHISITKSYPDKLLISVDRKSIFSYIETAGAFYEVSSDGFILKKTYSPNPSLSKVQIEGLKIKEGDILPKDLLLLLTFISDSKLNPSIQIESASVDASSQKGTIVLKDGTIIEVPLYKINPSFPASLQIIIDRFRIEGKKLSKIDFSFGKPVITFTH